jgi:3-deoxy-manno-octulosonate cytidylyltransferase (CMP-KDO synthetase)
MAHYIMIPAHGESRRLPGKLLLSETGKPLIQHTWENCLRLTHTSVFIATDNLELGKVCEGFGADVLYSTTPSLCGTHRVVEAFLNQIPVDFVASRARHQIASNDPWFNEDDVVVNVQAEWPTIDPEGIRRVISEVAHHDVPTMASLYYRAPATEDSNLVKVVLARSRNGGEQSQAPRLAMYFSRSPIPHGAAEFNYHVGVYALNRSMARVYHALCMQLPSFDLRSENLEQLCVLFNNYAIWMIETKPAMGIDTRELYDRFKCELQQVAETQAQAGYFA